MARNVEDENAAQAPQDKGRPVLWVLIGTMALCVTAIVGYMLWVGSSSPTDPSQAASQQLTGKPGDAASTSSTARTPSANPAYPAAPTVPSADTPPNRAR